MTPTAIPAMLISCNENLITLRNDFIWRELSLHGGITTTRLWLRAEGRRGADIWVPTSYPGNYAPYEVAVRVGKQEFVIGAAQNSTESFRRPDDFVITETLTEKTQLGEKLIINCLPGHDGAPALSVQIRYEIAAELPLIIKQIAITNIGTRQQIIDNVTVECLSWERYNKELQVFTDHYDTYGKAKCRDERYPGWILHQFPKPIHYRLRPDESLTSFRVFMYAVPDDAVAKSVAKARIFQALAPWTTQNSISQLIDGVDSYTELQDIAKTAQKNGIEMCHLYVNQLFTNIGDYKLRPDLFPGGDSDLKRLVDHFHKCRVKVVPYCSLTIAAQECCGEAASRICLENEHWQYLGPKGTRYLCYGWGNMCYGSPWGEYIQGKLDWLLSDIGFDGLHIDGPYHGLPCRDTHHAHRTAEAVHFTNWNFERELFSKWRQQESYFTVPQDEAALLFGANAVPGGYTELDHAALSGMPLATSNRTRLYNDRHRLPSNCVWALHALDPVHGQSIEASEENTASYDHSLGATFGYGHWGFFHGRQLYVGRKTKAIFRKWIKFYKKYRETLNGQFIHLVQPNGFHPDAMMHVNPESDPPAIIVAFNPSEKCVSLSLLLPLHYAGLGNKDTVEIERLNSVPLDTRGEAVITVRLEPFEIKAMQVRASR